MENSLLISEQVRQDLLQSIKNDMERLATMTQSEARKFMHERGRATDINKQARVDAYLSRKCPSTTDESRD